MSWHFCIVTREKLALKLCHGSIDKGTGTGLGAHYVSGGDGVSYGYGTGKGDGYGYGERNGWSCGVGYGKINGSGISTHVWQL